MVDETNNGTGAETNGAAIPDGFEQAMSEWEASGGDQTVSKPLVNGRGHSQDGEADDADKAEGAPDLKAITGELAELRAFASDVQLERLQDRDAEETDALIAAASDRLSDLASLPNDFAERWLRNECAVDPELRNAWDNRWQSPEADKQCRQAVRRALNKLRDSAEHENARIEGLAVTQDRAAISAAMLRGGGKAPPEGQAPDYRSMNDEQFRDHVKKEHGFTPRI